MTPADPMFGAIANPKVVPYDIGCEPESVSSEILLQDGWATFLLFRARSKATSDSGQLDDLGVAVLECLGCSATKFGYPNDEGLPEHPLYNHGMANAMTAVLEVVPSAWAEGVLAKKEMAWNRIWGAPSSKSAPRHFMICLKEATFECLAREMSVTRFFKDFQEAFAHVQARFSEHQ